MATGPIETHLHRSFNWENGAPGPQEGPRGRSANCGNGLFAQCVRLRSEINPHYLGGLFVYVGEGTEATPLIASKTEDKWTGELFSQVTTPKDTEQKDFANPATMDVNCFIYAADNTAEGSSASALAAAMDWANDLK